jgi:hypothetical protein
MRMAIKFNCPSCKSALSVKDDKLAGRKIGCPKCKKLVVIPRPTAAVAAAAAEDLDALAAAALAEPKPDPVVAQEAATMEFECPQCGEQVKMSREFAGKNAPCPECRRIIKVPMPKTKDPADWRKKDDTLPAGARRDTEPAPEGAWESSRAKGVSTEALLEAGLIPKKKKKPGLTRQQKINRAAIGVGAGLVILIAAFIASRSFAEAKRETVVEQALKAVDQQEGKSKETAAEAYRAAGEYHVRAMTRDAASRAQKAFAKSRDLLENSKAGAARDALLADLLVSQVDLGGSPDEVKRGMRLDWAPAPAKGHAALKDTGNTVYKELNQTLSHETSVAGRLYALRQVGRRLIDRGRFDEAIMLARQTAARKGGEGEEAEAAAYETPEALAIVGIEFFRVKLPEKAGQLADQALSRYDLAGADPKTRSPVAPSLVALCLALGKPEPKPGKGREKDDEVLLTLGRAAGLALKGDADAARNLARAPGLSLDQRFRILVAVAAVTGDATDLDAAAAMLDGDLSGQLVPSWLAYRLVEVATRLGQADRALHLAERVNDAGLRERALADVVRTRLASTRGKAGPGVLDGTEKGPLAQAMGREAMARHNAHFDAYATALKEAEAWDESVRPLGQLGAVLGELDGKGK